jgi:hypothetical protein
MGKKLSSEQKNKIRKEVLSGKTKYSVAKEMGISYINKGICQFNKR